MMPRWAAIPGCGPGWQSSPEAGKPGPATESWSGLQTRPYWNSPWRRPHPSDQGPPRLPWPSHRRRRRLRQAQPRCWTGTSFTPINWVSATPETAAAVELRSPCPRTSTKRWSCCGKVRRGMWPMAAHDRERRHPNPPPEGGGDNKRPCSGRCGIQPAILTRDTDAGILTRRL